jgi:hypothetical protein
MIMANYGKTETWKIVYYPTVLEAGRMGVALIEAQTRSDATYSFRHQYAGQFQTIESCEKLFD